MTKALVMYHSQFGNTRIIAEALAKGIESSGLVVDCKHIDDIEINQITQYAFISIGGPTHMIGTSKPMKAFLDSIKAIDLKGKLGFVFDTRVHSRMNTKRWFILENSAARRIENAFKNMGVSIIHPRESAIVNGTEGPLETGAETKFSEIGTVIGRYILDKHP